MEELEGACGRVLDAAADRRVIMIGGEHSVSAPAIRAHARRSRERLCVLQFDAHLDLRDSLDGSALSHACAMKRVIDDIDLVTVGARGISAEEWRVARNSDNVVVITGEEIGGARGVGAPGVGAPGRPHDWMDRALESLHDPVYITFDVDFFDPSLVPATGTPEPGADGGIPQSNSCAGFSVRVASSEPTLSSTRRFPDSRPRTSSWRN